MEKEYTTQELLDKYNKLSTKDKCTILSDAIDYMQTYNGRSKTACILMAMGYISHDYKTWEKDNDQN